MTDTLLTMTQIAEALGMRRSAPHYWRKKGWLHALKVTNSAVPSGHYYVATLADAQAARERANESRHAPRPRKKRLTDSDA